MALLCASLCCAHTQAATHHASAVTLLSHLGTHTHMHSRKSVEQGVCTSCLHAGVIPRCSQPASCLLTLRLSVAALPCCRETCAFLSQPFLFTLLCAGAAITDSLLEGGGLSPWFFTGSLWPSWPLWVSELPFCLNSCMAAAAAASAACPVAGSAPFPKVFRGSMGNERDQIFFCLSAQKTLRIYKFVFSVPF